MKKNFYSLLLVAAMLVAGFFTANAQTTNLLSHWSANNLGAGQTSVEGTEMWRWGYFNAEYTTSSDKFDFANGSGIRFCDVPNNNLKAVYDTDGNLLSDGTRFAMLRWDGGTMEKQKSHWLFANPNASATSNMDAIPDPLKLTAGTYTLSFNAGRNAYQSDIVACVTSDLTVKDATQVVGSLKILGKDLENLQTSTGAQMKHYSFDVTVENEGDYYVAFGPEDGKNVYTIWFVNDLSLSKVTTGVSQIKADETKVVAENSSVKVDFNLKKASNVKVSVYSVTGSLLAQSTQNCNAGNNTSSLNVNLAKGVYLLSLTKNGNTVTKKFVK